METCRGTTKAGARCKRPPSPGSDYCSTHEGQARSRPNDTRARATAGTAQGDRWESEYDDLDRLIGVVALGFLVCVVIALRGGRLF